MRITSVISKVVTKSSVSEFSGEKIPLLFLFGHAAKVGLHVYRATNSSNPVVLTLNLTRTVVSDCSPPLAVLVLKYTIFVATTAHSVVCSNLVSIGASVHYTSKIYAKCLNL